jgi:ERCC4-type nuclease
VSRVNEDDEKLQTSIIEEKDQGSILIIGGVEIFLPSGRGEASTDVADATERQQTETVKEEKEQILRSVPTEGEEHSTESLDVFSQEVEQEMTAALESAAEEGKQIA